MPKCPNCGWVTARTEDWACQWCGYPLSSKSYKKIPKTYKQLKEEKRGGQESPVPEETMVPPLPYDSALAAARTLEPVSEPVPEETMVPPLPYDSALAAARTLELVSEPVPEETMVPPLQDDSALATAHTLELVSEPVPEHEAELILESEPILEPEATLAPEPEPEPVLVSEPEPTPTAIEVTVEELLAAYKEDEAAADARFTNKIVRVTGSVNRIEVRDYLDFSYITLTGIERNALQNVRCFFDKKHDPELSQLVTGQRVTVQGKYDGSIVNLRVVHCVLVR